MADPWPRCLEQSAQVSGERGFRGRQRPRPPLEELPGECRCQGTPLERKFLCWSHLSTPSIRAAPSGGEGSRKDYLPGWGSFPRACQRNHKANAGDVACHALPVQSFSSCGLSFSDNRKGGRAQPRPALWSFHTQEPPFSEKSGWLRGDTAGEWGAVSEARDRGEQTSPHANAKVAGVGGSKEISYVTQNPERKKKWADLGWVVRLLIQQWSQCLFDQRRELILE